MENKKNVNYTGLLSVIVVLLLVVIGQNFYLAMNVSKTDVVSVWEDRTLDKKVVDSKVVDAKSNSDVEITMITDKRCGDKCNVEPIISQLKQIPSLSNVNIKVLDYSEKGAKDELAKTGVKKLPAALFNVNTTPELTKILKWTKNWMYSLDLWSTFDPTAKRSKKWFLILDKKILSEIKKDSYIKWNKEAKVTWIEYSDLECPFCAKLHNQGTSVDLEKKYGDKLNQVFQNFPLSFHKNAAAAAEILECLGKEKWIDAYYKLKNIAYNKKNSNKDFLINEAVKLGANKKTITKCADNKTFLDKINNQQQLGAKTFNISWTPGVVLVNNETGEYKVISWAYPTKTFDDTIAKLLK